MTSTSFNVGIGEETRLSSRVLRPPGGGHTDIFGGEPEPPQTGRRGPPASSITFGPDSPVKPTNGAVDAPTQNGQQTPTEPSVPAPTPEAKQSPPKPEAPKMEAPKRVRVPPGGFSSGLW